MPSTQSGNSRPCGAIVAEGVKEAVEHSAPAFPGPRHGSQQPFERVRRGVHMLPDLHQALSSSRLNERVRLERVANNPAPFLPKEFASNRP